MVNSIVISSYPSSEKPGEVRFEAVGSYAVTAAEAMREIADGGGDAKFIAFVGLDGDDAGLRAVAATVELAINADRGVGTETIRVEELFLTIFDAGVKYGLKAAEGTTDQ
jgi:hypothetical protein